MVKHDDLPIQIGQFGDSFFESISSCFSFNLLVSDFVGVWEDSDGIDWDGAFLSVAIDTRVSGNTEDPGFKRALRIVAMKAPQSPEEHVLAGLLGFLGYAKHSKAIAVDGRSIVFRDPISGVCFARDGRKHAFFFVVYRVDQAQRQWELLG